MALKDGTPGQRVANAYSVHISDLPEQVAQQVCSLLRQQRREQGGGVGMTTFLTADALHHDEAGYRIEEGTYVEPVDHLTTRLTDARDVPPTAFERQVEEARWAARSGPVRIIRPATVTAIGQRRATATSSRTGVAA